PLRAASLAPYTTLFRSFLQGLRLNARTFIPASAKEGENVARASMKMKWYCASNVLEALDLLESQRTDVDLPLRFCVQDVYRFDGDRKSTRLNSSHEWIS